MLESSRSLELDSFLTRSLSSSSLPSSPEVGGGGFISASRTAPVFLGRDLAGSIFLFWLGAYGTTWFFWPSDDNLRARNAQVPYQKTSSGDIFLDFELNRPLIDPPTIPSNLLLFTAIFLPLVIVFVQGWRNASRGNRYDCSTGIAALLTALAVSECCTVSLKFYVRRRRPNFYALCQWSKKQLACTAPFKEQVEAQLSFPSGHSSLTFCGMTFLALYLWGQVGMHQFYNGTMNANSSSNNIDGAGGRISSIPLSKRGGALLACLGPWCWAAIVGASRIVDHWHHPSDVVAGTMLGTASALVVYHLFYHPVVSPQAGMPLLSFTSRRMLEKLPTVQD